MGRKPRTIIHVNQHVIKANRKYGLRLPVLTVKQGRSNRYCHEVEISGPSRVVHRPEKPLSCGAVCWIETESHVTLIEEETCEQRACRIGRGVTED